MQLTRQHIIIALPIIIAMAMLLPLRQAKINPDLNEYLPQNTPAKLNIERVDSIFGKYDPILMIIKADDVINSSTLERISDISYEFIQAPEIKNVISLFEVKYIRGEEGAMLVDPAVRFIPEDEHETELLRQELLSNPLAVGLLVSEDFTYTLMLLNAEENVSDEELFEYINGVLELYPGDEQVFFSGMPYLRYEMQRLATRDLAMLLPMGLLLMILFLYFSFREIRGVVLPLSIVMMSIVVAIGLMPLLGYELSLIAILTPILMVAITNNYGVHIIARYQELNARNPSWSMKEIVSHATERLKRPIIFTGLTTIVGVLGLVVHIMLPARQMGIVSAAGIAFALILSITFLPAILSRMKKGKVHKSYLGKRRTITDHFLIWSSRVSTKKPMLTIGIFAIIFLAAGSGMIHLRVNINNENMMPRKHSIRKATDIANSSFGGTKYVSVLFKGDIKSPEVMHSMDNFSDAVKEIENVGNVTGVSTVIRLMSKSLLEPDDRFYDRIPDSRSAIAQYIELYNMSGDPEDFEQLVDFNYENALVNIQFSAKDLASFNKTIGQIEKLAEDAPYSTITAGLCKVEKEMAVSIARGQIYSLIFALLAIIILLWIIFRSFRSGILGALPLFFTLGCNFGLMGWAGFELDIATSLLSSIAIGLGIDYTIHTFWRIKHELGLDKSWEEAVKTTLTTTGKGIAVNAFSVMLGFSVLFFSNLVILQSFALLIIVSLLLCLLCALVLIPAICIVTKPGFLIKRNGTDLYNNNNNNNNK